MKSWMLLASVFLAGAAQAADDLPWTFGMSPEQVRAVSAFGPYKAFANGDLETFHGRWDDQDENIPFYFKDGRLARTSVFFHEGHDPAEAAARWLALRRSMQRHFG